MLSMTPYLMSANRNSWLTRSLTNTRRSRWLRNARALLMRVKKLQDFARNRKNRKPVPRQSNPSGQAHWAKDFQAKNQDHMSLSKTISMMLGLAEFYMDWLTQEVRQKWH